MNLKWTALAAMALLTPAAFAQQNYGWVVSRQYQETWNDWLTVTTYANPTNNTINNVQFTSPNLPFVGVNKVWGAAYSGCPWTAPFATLFETSYSHSWQVPQQVPLYDDDTQTSGPAPFPLNLEPGKKVFSEYRYYRSWGYETWVWVDPQRGIEVVGAPPEQDKGPHRRDREVKAPFEMRIQIVDLS